MTVAGDAPGGGGSGAAAGAAQEIGNGWLGGDPAKLNAPIKTVKDKYELLPAFLKVRARSSWRHACGALHCEQCTGH